MVDFSLSADENRIILALSPSKNYRENIITLIREIQKRGLVTIIISINQPAAFLTDLFARNGIDTSRVFFIDAITRYATGPSPECPPNCRFVNKPNDLTSIGIAVTEVLKKFEQEKTVIFMDSVNAMLIHSSSVDLTKFIHFVISKLRILNIAGIFLAVEKGLDPVLLSQLTTFSDELIEFPENKSP